MMAKHRRGPWSREEDSYLVQLVHAQGAHNWPHISQLMNSRSPKQCRERYHQSLKPSLNLTRITANEGLMIECMVTTMGKRWAEIGRRLQGRSDNIVKNWWNSRMNRRKRSCNRHGDTAAHLAQSKYTEPPHLRPSHMVVNQRSATADMYSTLLPSEPLVYSQAFETLIPSRSVVSHMSLNDSSNGPPPSFVQCGDTCSAYSQSSRFSAQNNEPPTCCIMHSEHLQQILEHHQHAPLTSDKYHSLLKYHSYPSNFQSNYSYEQHKATIKSSQHHSPQPTKQLPLQNFHIVVAAPSLAKDTRMSLSNIIN